MIDYAGSSPSGVSSVTPSSTTTSFVDKIKKIFSRSTHQHSKRTSVFSNKNIGTLLFIAIVAFAVITGFAVTASRATKGNRSTLGATAPSVATVTVNHEYSFNAYNKDKKLADPVSYTITEAQLTKTIVIKGQKATAVPGRTFLILNLKLVNDTNQSLFLNTRNYLRIQAKNSQDKLAPEIHNDTIEVQPLSTKLTRIGLPVNETDHEFTLFIGELDGGKEEVPLKF